MSIWSGLLRRARLDEVVGCPLAQAASGERACAACKYNVVAPGHPRVGCEIATSAADYHAAFDRLRALAPAGSREVEGLLAEQRRTAHDPLAAAAATRIAALAELWPTQLERGSAEAKVATILLAFTRFAAETGEDVRVLA